MVDGILIIESLEEYRAHADMDIVLIEGYTLMERDFIFILINKRFPWLIP